VDYVDRNKRMTERISLYFCLWRYAFPCQQFHPLTDERNKKLLFESIFHPLHSIKKIRKELRNRREGKETKGKKEDDGTESRVD